MGLDITTKAVVERIVRGVRAAEQQSVKMGLEESAALSSLILDIKKRIGEFVRERNDLSNAIPDDDLPVFCTFCGSRELKFRRPWLPGPVWVHGTHRPHICREEQVDARMSGYWFCLSCGQEIRVRSQDVFGESIPSMQRAAG